MSPEEQTKRIESERLDQEQHEIRNRYYYEKERNALDKLLDRTTDPNLKNGIK